MQTIVFFSVKDDLKHKEVFRVTLDNGEVRMKGNQSVSQMLKKGVYYKGKTWYPKDGAPFVKALPFAFAGSRFYAVEER